MNHISIADTQSEVSRQDIRQENAAHEKWGSDRSPIATLLPIDALADIMEGMSKNGRLPEENY